MESVVPRYPAEIWERDLFDRRVEAEQLIGYIESLTSRPAREDHKAFTIAVDAQYGEGKSFFVRRLAEHLAINHPVAFVDAWADDLADEPLTALAATLKRALEPFVTKPEVRERVSTFMSKAGKVAKIASVGLLKKGVSLAITSGALESIEGVVSGLSDDANDLIEDAVKAAAEGVVADVAHEVKNITSHELMQKRVAAFEEGRAAVREMTESLAAIVKSLDGSDRHPPIVIVIDELDRCRPTYAIKLLEEIKHLFDVPGLVFILAIHSGQLAHSVAGAYGSSFDGRGYLRRFIDRGYSLAQPSLCPLVKKLCEERKIQAEKLKFPPTVKSDGARVQADIYSLISEYMRVFGLSARDAYQVVDVLETSICLTGDQPVYGAYLLPLLIGHLLGLPRGVLPKEKSAPNLAFIRSFHAPHQDIKPLSIEKVAQEFAAAVTMSDGELHEANAAENVSFGIRAINSSRAWNSDNLPLWDVARYPDLIAAVARFSNPSTIAAEKQAEEPEVKWLT